MSPQLLACVAIQNMIRERYQEGDQMAPCTYHPLITDAYLRCDAFDASRYIDWARGRIIEADL